MIEVLLRHNAGLDAVSVDGLTALHQCVQEGRVDLLPLLLARAEKVRLDVDVAQVPKARSHSPLWLAVFQALTSPASSAPAPHLPLVRMLFDAGANPRLPGLFLDKGINARVSPLELMRQREQERWAKENPLRPAADAVAAGRDLNTPLVRLMQAYEAIWDARSSRALSLGGKLRALPDGLTLLPTHLPAVFRMSALTSLDLRSNLLSSLPPEIASLGALRDLDASDNHLERLPASLGDLRHLTRLDVSRNRLIALPPSLSKCAGLERLDVSDNPLNTIPLAVDRTSLPDLKEYLRLLFTGEGRPSKSVKLLVVGQENVGKTSILACLNALVERKKKPASGAASSGASSSPRPESVRSAEPASAPPAAAAASAALKSALSFTDKFKERLKEEIKGVAQSTSAAASSATSGPAPSAGSGGGGAAAAAAAPGSAPQTLSTDGIEIKALHADDDCTFMVYDFGGQQIFYPTHQFFLTANAIYLLVFNVSDLNHSKIEYWLRNIKVRTNNQNAPVVLVGTHLDALKRDTSFKEELHAALLGYRERGFPQIHDVVFVSNKSREGVPELRNLLVTLAKQKMSAALKEIIPNSYVDVLEHIYHLRNEHKIVVDWAEFREIPPRVGHKQFTKEAQLLSMARFLHGLGEIMFFEQDQNLKDQIILNPQYLAQVMCTIITFKSNWAKDGVLKSSLLPMIWKQFPADTHATLLNVLKKFEILLPLKDDFLVPCLLPEEGVAEEQGAHWPLLLDLEPHVRQYGRRYIFSFLPIGFFSRVMVRLLAHSLLEELYKWKYGIVVRMKTQVALISCNQRDSVLEVKVRDPTPDTGLANKKNLLKTLTYVVESLIEQFYPGMQRDIRRTVPCTHCVEAVKARMPRSYSREEMAKFEADKVHQFSYEECLECITSGNTVLQCPRDDDAVVHIHTIAPDILKDEPIAPDQLVKEAVLGVGGYGVVYRGVWKKQIPVAIKELLGEESAAGYAEAYQEFQLEAYIMSCLNHPNILRLYGITVQPLALVMELMTAGDLHGLLEPLWKADVVEEHTPLRLKAVVVIEQEHTLDNGMHVYDVQAEDGQRVTGVPAVKLKLRPQPLLDTQLSARLRLKIMLDMARGMAYLASRTPPIIHRDLRSPNVFISDLDLERQEVTAKIADFGLAREVISETSGFLKTWQWLPPEVIDLANTGYDEKADTYSYGMVVWEILTRRTPFDEFYDDPRFIRNGQFQPMDCKLAVIEHGLRPTLPPSCPAPLRAVVERCWLHEPADRPPFPEIVDVLCDLLGLPREGQAAEPAARRARKQTQFGLRVRTDSTSGSAPPLVHQLKHSGTRMPKAGVVNQLVECRATGTVWAAMADGSLAVWDAKAHTLAKTLPGAHAGGGSVGCGAVALAAADEVWSAGADQNVVAWDVRTYKQRKVLPRAHKAVVRVLAALPDSDVCWSADVGGEIVCWSVSKKKQLHTMNVKESLYSCCVVKDELWFGGEYTLFRVHSASYAVTKYNGAHSAAINALVFTNGAVWSGSQDQKLKVWNAKTCVMAKEITDSTTPVTALCAFQSPNRSVLLSGSKDGRLMCFDIESYGRVPNSPDSPHSDAIRAFAQVGNNELWAAAADDTISTWLFEATTRPQVRLGGSHRDGGRPAAAAAHPAAATNSSRGPAPAPAASAALTPTPAPAPKLAFVAAPRAFVSAQVQVVPRPFEAAVPSRSPRNSHADGVPLLGGQRNRPPSERPSVDGGLSARASLTSSVPNLSPRSPTLTTPAFPQAPAPASPSVIPPLSTSPQARFPSDPRDSHAMKPLPPMPQLPPGKAPRVPSISPRNPMPSIAPPPPPGGAT